jgi:NADPH:quinone reductase-like Zn-dependent oxidoreductase
MGPGEFTFEEGAAFPLQGMTAHYLIQGFRRPVPGSFVLIHAAAGGMGGLLVQWAKHLGANVIGTVSTEAKARTARRSWRIECVFPRIRTVIADADHESRKFARNTKDGSYGSSRDDNERSRSRV